MQNFLLSFDLRTKSIRFFFLLMLLLLQLKIRFSIQQEIYQFFIGFRRIPIKFQNKLCHIFLQRIQFLDLCFADGTAFHSDLCRTMIRHLFCAPPKNQQNSCKASNCQNRAHSNFGQNKTYNANCNQQNAPRHQSRCVCFLFSFRFLNRLKNNCFCLFFVVQCIDPSAVILLLMNRLFFRHSNGEDPAQPFPFALILF